MRPILSFALILGALSGPAVADRAVLAGVPDRDDRIWRGLPEAGEAVLARSGFRTTRIDGALPEVRAALRSLLADAIDPRETLVIHLHGQFARSDRNTWFLGSEAEASDLPHAGRDGLLLDTVLEIAARHPGRAFVLLGEEDDAPRHGPGLSAGIAPFEVPQGVTVLRGPARDLARWSASVLFEEAALLTEAVAETADITALGYLPPDHVLNIARAEGDTAADTPGRPRAAGDQPKAAEEVFWQQVRAEDTESGYRDYLQRYPRGFFRQEAQAALDALLADPARQAEAAETALDLSAPQRRAVQRDLTALGYDTRGVDGIFGPGTRSALRQWQDREGYAVTGFLTGAQRDRLRAQAEAVRAERAAERDAARRLWADIGGENASASDLRLYLDSYPDGENAARAQELLAIYDRARDIDSGRRDQADWIAARRADTPEAYRSYLRDRPDGAFADLARDRLRALTGNAGLGNGQEQAQARRQEDALQMGMVTRVLIERRLEQLGYNTGLPDGRFDDRTREAIARYQSDRGLPVTGYISDETSQRMLMEAGISFTRP